jgi:Predicted metal-binding, possibly nucleic acid-binding protein
MTKPPYSVPVRLHQIGARLELRFEPSSLERAAIAKELDLAELALCQANGTVEPRAKGWRFSGQLKAVGTQICGITLEPLPFQIDESFEVAFAEVGASHTDEQIMVALDDDSPDLIDDGQVDLGIYLTEQLALRLDPFPRKPGAVFQQPDEPVELSPFAVLKARNVDKS